MLDTIVQHESISATEFFIPNKRLAYLINLCWDNLATKEDQRIFPPKGSVVHKVVSCCYQQSLAEMIKNDIENRVQKLAEKSLLRQLLIAIHINFIQMKSNLL